MMLLDVNKHSYNTFSFDYDVDIDTSIDNYSEIENLIRLKQGTTRQIVGHMSTNNKTLFFRRATYNSNENLVLFTEKETKSIIKFDPIREVFIKQECLNNVKNPFAILYLKEHDCYLVSDLDDECNCKIKLFDKNFSLLNSFWHLNFDWPYDIKTSNERDVFISDFNSNSIFQLKLTYNQLEVDGDEGELKSIKKLNEYMPIDMKIIDQKLFIVNSCNYEASNNKLIYVEEKGNLINVYDINTFERLSSIKHETMLQPQGLFIQNASDNQQKFIYIVGLYIDCNFNMQRLIHDDLHLFCFNFNTNQLVNTQSLAIKHNFELIICDIVFWSSEAIKKLFLTAFKHGLFAIDIE